MPKLTNQRSTRHLGAGMTMAVVVGLFAWGGHELDQWSGLQPLFVLLGVLLGGVGGFLHVIAVVAPEMLPFRTTKTSRQAAGAIAAKSDERSPDGKAAKKPSPDLTDSEP